MAVAQERLRFARDLHDLLGYSVSAITLKSELVRRLVPARLTRARAEIESALEVTRQALSDVRAVASGYREMPLEAETESAASILTAADVDARVDMDCGRLDPIVDTTLATVLREGVTNVLRHSQVKICDVNAHIEGDVVRLTLVNDGVVGKDTAAPGSGSGLSNLSTRLKAIGGTLDASVTEDGRFRLQATAPLRPESVPPRPVDRVPDSRGSPEELVSAPPVDQHVPTPRLARSITIKYPFGYASVMVLGVIAQSSGIPQTVGLTCVISLFLIQLHICVEDRSAWTLRRRVLLIITQVALLVTLFAVTGPLYGGMAALLAATALLLLPSRAAWSLFGLTISGVVIVGVLSRYSSGELVFVVLNVAVTGLAIYGLTRLADLVREIHAARANWRGWP